MSEAKAIPSATLEVQGTTASRDTTSRENVIFQARMNPTDAGITLYDPQGYFCNMSLTGLRALHAWLGGWITYQRERFKPTGFALVHITTAERREQATGEKLIVVGDSFYIQAADGAQLGEALPFSEWEIVPLFTSS